MKSCHVCRHGFCAVPRWDYVCIDHQQKRFLKLSSRLGVPLLPEALSHQNYHMTRSRGAIPLVLFLLSQRDGSVWLSGLFPLTSFLWLRRLLSLKSVLVMNKVVSYSSVEVCTSGAGNKWEKFVLVPWVSFLGTVSNNYN